MQDYINQLETSNKSPHTIEGVMVDLADFKEWFKQANDEAPEPAAITSIDLKEYKAYLQSVRELGPGTINRRFINLRNYLNWAREAGHISRLPNFPEYIKIQKGAPQAISRKEQNRLIRTAEQRAERDGKLRELALLRLLLSCGLRISEAVQVKISDLELGPRHGELKVCGKGNKYREVPVPPQTRKVINEWLEVLQEKHPECPWLFPNKRGNPITPRYGRQIIKEIAEFARVQNIHPHTLRHTAATNMLQTGSDLVTVAEILGHESLESTQIYTRPGKKTMADAVEKGEI